MNTQINMMKAYATLYQVWPDEILHQRILELMDIFQTKLYDREGKHLLVNCDDYWNSLEEIHYYGHDIETAWLLVETAEVLGYEDLKQKAEAAVKDFNQIQEAVKEKEQRLAEIESNVIRLADAIKKTQKRTNALSNIMIPKFTATIKFISDALDEKEREDFEDSYEMNANLILQQTKTELQK